MLLSLSRADRIRRVGTSLAQRRGRTFDCVPLRLPFHLRVELRREHHKTLAMNAVSAELLTMGGSVPPRR